MARLAHLATPMLCYKYGICQSKKSLLCNIFHKQLSEGF